MNFLLEFREQGVKTGGSVVGGRLKILPNGPEEDEAVKQLMLKRNLIFLIHGFNVNRDEGRDGLGNLSSFVHRTGETAVVSVLWPGDHWAGFLSYPFEGRDADATAIDFAKFIDLAVRPDAALSFISHSMGARVAMETAKIITNKGKLKISQICLMAPAIDDFSLSRRSNYRAAAEAANRVAVLSSVEDEVLRYAYPAGDLVQSLLFGDDVFGAALGYRGPSADPSRDGKIPSTVIHTDIPADRDADHGDYIPDFRPPSTPDGKAQKNQRSAAGYADQVVNGEPKPSYK